MRAQALLLLSLVALVLSLPPGPTSGPSSPGGAGHALLFHDSPLRLEPFSDMPTAELTFEAWVASTDSCHTGTLLSYAEQTDSPDPATRTAAANAFVVWNIRNVVACRGFQYLLLIPDPARSSCVSMFGDPATVKTADLTDRSGAWHHVAVTWSAARNGMTQIFKDGKIHDTAATCESPWTDYLAFILRGRSLGGRGGDQQDRPACPGWLAAAGRRAGLLRRLHRSQSGVPWVSSIGLDLCHRNGYLWGCDSRWQVSTPPPCSATRRGAPHLHFCFVEQRREDSRSSSRRPPHVACCYLLTASRAASWTRFASGGGPGARPRFSDTCEMAPASRTTRTWCSTTSWMTPARTVSSVDRGLSAAHVLRRRLVWGHSCLQVACQTAAVHPIRSIRTAHKAPRSLRASGSPFCQCRGTVPRAPHCQGQQRTGPRLTAHPPAGHQATRAARARAGPGLARV